VNAPRRSIKELSRHFGQNRTFQPLGGARGKSGLKVSPVRPLGNGNVFRSVLWGTGTSSGPASGERERLPVRPLGNGNVFRSVLWGTGTSSGPASGERECPTAAEMFSLTHAAVQKATGSLRSVPDIKHTNTHGQNQNQDQYQNQDQNQNQN